MAISKGAADPDRLRWELVETPNARSAIAGYLSRLQLDHPVRVLVPAYYGWSPNEGSGVMDPLRSVGAKVRLVRVTRDLQLDLDDYREALAGFEPDVVMPISYFGWPDEHFDQIVRAARDVGATVLEDGAHSLLTSLLHGSGDEAADAIAFSLHKSLPLPSGGLLARRGAGRSVAESGTPRVWDYDLGSIGALRRRNAELIAELLRDQPDVRLLRPSLPPEVVPLNVPVLVPPQRRQEVYVALNDAGFGVVSLYYKLGPGIELEQHPESFWLSSRLVNLPCHQDVDPAEIPAMVAALLDVVRSGA